jgi:hypothetical protein
VDQPADHYFWVKRKNAKIDLELGHLGLEFLPLPQDGEFGAGIHAGAQMFKSVLVYPAIERCLLLADTTYRVL